MGQAKRRGIKDERIAQAIERDEKHQKRARRFFHLCRFICRKAITGSNSLDESIIACGRNRGFEATNADHLPGGNNRQMNTLWPYIAIASLFGDGYSLPKKGFR